jgi:hypothetical protein
LHADAHNFRSHPWHLSVILVWLSNDAWLQDPTHVRPSSQVVC